MSNIELILWWTPIMAPIIAAAAYFISWARSRKAEEAAAWLEYLKDIKNRP